MRSAPHRRGRGFTLIELVMVMAIVGALATFVLPRWIDLSMWRARSYVDDLQSQLQALQRLALAQRRPVSATFAAGGASFAYVVGGSLGSLDCPVSISPCIAAGAGGSVVFNAANGGRTTTSGGGSQVLTVQGGGFSASLAIEPETGLIRRLP